MSVLLKSPMSVPKSPMSPISPMSIQEPNSAQYLYLPTTPKQRMFTDSPNLNGMDSSLYAYKNLYFSPWSPCSPVLKLSEPSQALDFPDLGLPQITSEVFKKSKINCSLFNDDDIQLSYYDDVQDADAQDADAQDADAQDANNSYYADILLSYYANNPNCLNDVNNTNKSDENYENKPLLKRSCSNELAVSLKKTSLKRSRSFNDYLDELDGTI